MCAPGFGLFKTWQGIVEMVLRVTCIVSDAGDARILSVVALSAVEGVCSKISLRAFKLRLTYMIGQI